MGFGTQKGSKARTALARGASKGVFLSTCSCLGVCLQSLGDQMSLKRVMVHFAFMENYRNTGHAIPILGFMWSQGIGQLESRDLDRLRHAMHNRVRPRSTNSKPP